MEAAVAPTKQKIGEWFTEQFKEFFPKDGDFSSLQRIRRRFLAKFLQKTFIFRACQKEIPDQEKRFIDIGAESVQVLLYPIQSISTECAKTVLVILSSDWRIKNPEGLSLEDLRSIRILSKGRLAFVMDGNITEITDEMKAALKDVLKKTTEETE